MKIRLASLALTSAAAAVIAVGCSTSHQKDVHAGVAAAAAPVTSPARFAGDPEEKSPLKPVGRDYMDLDKNGKMDPYEDPNLPIERRIDDLLSKMNLDEKTCQLCTLYGFR